MNEQNRWMLYGANGYTGELIAREAARRGLKPVLAGRRRESVETLARTLGLQACVFDLDDPAALAEQVRGYALVLNCAGPFSATAAAMMQACLGAGAHYLDITGEIAVFEHAQSLHARAQEAGVVLCPGVGFDVIPTDCVAAALKAALPDATHLALGFDSRSGFSPGTAKTSVEGLAQGGKVRREGEIITVPLAYAVRRIDFGDGGEAGNDHSLGRCVHGLLHHWHSEHRSIHSRLAAHDRSCQTRQLHSPAARAGLGAEDDEGAHCQDGQRTE